MSPRYETQQASLAEFLKTAKAIRATAWRGLDETQETGDLQKDYAYRLLIDLKGHFCDVLSPLARDGEIAEPVAFVKWSEGKNAQGCIYFALFDREEFFAKANAAAPLETEATPYVNLFFLPQSEAGAAFKGQTPGGKVETLVTLDSSRAELTEEEIATIHDYAYTYAKLGLQSLRAKARPTKFLRPRATTTATP